MASAVTQKGQVTIPKSVRDALGIRPGTRVAFETDGRGGARLVLPDREDDAVRRGRGDGRVPDDLPAEGGFARFLGIGLNPEDLTTDEYMRRIRDDIDA